jgi:microcystin-dependent protein
MGQPFVGEIRLFGGNFAPAGWQFCDGSILSIAENDVLFALIGTTYGGDGQATFAVPDFRGRVPVHQGQGTGLSNYVIGQTGGVETVTVSGAQLPVHTHPVAAVSQGGTLAAPAATAVLSDMGPQGSSTVFAYKPYDGTAQIALAGASVAQSGGNQPHENSQPYLTCSFIISLFGIFPSQN